MAKGIPAKDSVFRSYHFVTLLLIGALAIAMLITGHLLFALATAAFALVEVGLLYMKVHGRFSRKEEWS